MEGCIDCAKRALKKSWFFVITTHILLVLQLGRFTQRILGHVESTNTSIAVSAITTLLMIWLLWSYLNDHTKIKANYRRLAGKTSS